MRDYVLSHLGDAELLRRLGDIVAKDRSITTALLAHLAEVGSRRLYAPAGYPSMEAYCIHELRFSEDVAHKRIRAARKAREYPPIFDMLADGRLSLSGVLLIGSWLKPENAAELLAVAENKTLRELEELIAERFPRTEVLPLAVPAKEEPANPGTVPQSEVAARPPLAHIPSKLAPIARNRYVLQVSISKDTHEKLEYAQALMSHVAGCDLARVFDRALDTLIAKLEKDRCGAAARPGRRRRPTLNPRHIPAHVKNAVWKRDGGRCTFTTESGHRCPARHRLQYDHIVPLAQGGETTVPNVRLLCSVHNLLEAERAFGTEYVRAKCEASKEARKAARERKKEGAALPSSDPERDVVPWLRHLGAQPDHIRLAAAHCETLPEGTSLDDRVREAIKYVGRLRFPRLYAQQSAAPSPAS